MLEIDSMNVNVSEESQQMLTVDVLDVVGNNSELNISQNKKILIFYVTLDKVDAIHNIEMWDVKGNYDFVLEANTERTPYISIQHNLNYHYNKKSLEEFENVDKMQELVENGKQHIKESNENSESEYYLSSDELTNIHYEVQFYTVMIV